jgi:hypothetical protein
MFTATKTIYADDLLLSMMHGDSYSPMANTTLNEKFNINVNMFPDVGVYPKLSYIAIGNGGITTAVADNVLNQNAHSAIDGALFNHIPFVIRTPDNDLSIEEASKYRLRKESIINGVEYIEYYLKVIVPRTDNDLRLIEINNSDAMGSSITHFNPKNYRVLNPIPRLLVNYLENSTVKFVGRSIRVNLDFSIEELININTAMKIKYGLDESKYNITEIALCSGLDITDDEGRIETYSTQTMYFVDSAIDVVKTVALNKPIYRDVEVGGCEPIILK